MYYYIYQITNIKNNKIYIGKKISKKLDDGYMGSGKQIKLAIKKYGLEFFKKEILFIFNNEKELSAKEKEIVTEEFCKRKDTYNMREGGDGGFCHIKNSPEYISWCRLGGKKAYENMKKIPNFEKNKFKKNDERTIALSEKANEKRKNLGISDEHRSKISNYQKLNNSMYEKCWCVKEDSLDFNERKVYPKNNIPKGWVSCTERRKQLKNKIKTFGYFWIFNDEKRENLYIKNSEIPEGWKKGRKMEYKKSLTSKNNSDMLFT